MKTVLVSLCDVLVWGKHTILRGKALSFPFLSVIACVCLGREGVRGFCISRFVRLFIPYPVMFHLCPVPTPLRLSLACGCVTNKRDRKDYFYLVNQPSFQVGSL